MRVKQKCLLCDGLPAPPAGLSYHLHGYLFGFADGARAAREGTGPLLCEEHQKHLDNALAARGIAAKRPG